MSNESIEIKLVAIFIIVIFIAICMVVLFGIFLSRKNKIVTEKLEKELAYQKRLHATELKALRGQMNPHFVHNSINAIQYYIQRNDVETSEYYLTKFSKLLRLFFDYSRRQYVTIDEEILLLENYLAIEKLRFEDKISYNITVDPKVAQESLRLPSMMLQPIVENAINHGLFHKQENGSVTILFKYIDELTFQIIIKDDGIGINKAQKLKPTGQSTNKNHSSHVLEERIELINAGKEQNLNLQVEDLSETTKNTGTRVTITLTEILKNE